MEPAYQTGERFMLKHLPTLIKKTAVSWNKYDPWRLSAIVAYYAILSLPGLLVIIIKSLSYIFGTNTYLPDSHISWKTVWVGAIFRS
jgi:uncharacterized BrkB/YihY/UPF0761 family membrane protein